MKLKTTRKEIMECHARVYSVGYGGLQPLDRYLPPPTAYSCGIYGWNYDVYEFGNVAICTGYRGMPGKDLPEKANRILRNSEKYESILRKLIPGDAPEDYSARWKRKERYMKTAARRLTAALEE